MSSQVVMAVAIAGIVVGAAAATAEVRSADALPLGGALQGVPAGGKCAVKVLRNGEIGKATVFRDELADGSCQCTVTTGAADKNGAAENVVTALLRDRECNGAPNSPAGEGAGFAPSGALLPVAAGVGAAGGLGAALGSASQG